jgi:hypothetical protein
MIIGYSFGDNHINRMIEEAVDSNLSLKVIVADKDVEKEVKKVDGEKTNLKNRLMKYSENSARIIFFGKSFEKFVELLPEVSYENEREKTLKEALQPQKQEE